jgi:hypothetical protein
MLKNIIILVLLLFIIIGILYVTKKENNYKTDIKRLGTLIQEEKNKKPEIVVFKEQVSKGEGLSNVTDQDIIQVLCTIYGVDKDLIMAIAIHETGHFKSYAYKNYNNPGGMVLNGNLRKFDNIETGYDFMIRNIKDNYINKGLRTIKDIGNKYAPVGINDAGDVNKYWVDYVSRLYYGLKDD